MLYIACCSQKHGSLVMVTVQMEASDMLLSQPLEKLEKQAVQVNFQNHRIAMHHSGK